MTSFSRYRPFFIMGSCYLVLMQMGLVTLFLVTASAAVGRADFRMLYTGGSMVRTGQAEQLYNYEETVTNEARMAGKGGANLPFNHPAYEALLFAVLSWLPDQQAFWLFFAVNLGLLLVSYRLLMPAS
jgi:hypothetical protein